MQSWNLHVQHSEDSLCDYLQLMTLRNGELECLMRREVTRGELLPIYLQKALTSLLADMAHAGAFDPADLP